MASVWEFMSDLGVIGWIMLMIIAVVAIEGVVVIVKMWIKHRERMAMIQKGMDPGSSQDAYKKDEV
jgi:cytochrome c oxidase assembly factor CtaG